MSVPRQPSPPWRRTWPRRVLLVLGSAVLLYGAVLLAALVLDHVGVQTMTCRVTSASTVWNGGGRSTSSPGVMVRTEDCGDILLERGVTPANADEVAASFEPGSTHEFDMGWTSRTIAPHLRITPTAREYR